jgi:hypothetical protein
MQTYSTKQAANLAGIHWVTLFRWLAAEKVRPSVAIPLDGRTLWRWTEADVKQVRRYKTKFYRKGRGRKAQKKSGNREVASFSVARPTPNLHRRLNMGCTEDTPTYIFHTTKPHRGCDLCQSQHRSQWPRPYSADWRIGGILPPSRVGSCWLLR